MTLRLRPCGHAAGRAPASRARYPPVRARPSAACGTGNDDRLRPGPAPTGPARQGSQAAGEYFNGTGGTDRTCAHPAASAFRLPAAPIRSGVRSHRFPVTLCSSRCLPHDDPYPPIWCQSRRVGIAVHALPNRHYVGLMTWCSRSWMWPTTRTRRVAWASPLRIGCSGWGSTDNSAFRRLGGSGGARHELTDLAVRRAGWLGIQVQHPRSMAVVGTVLARRRGRKGQVRQAGPHDHACSLASGRGLWYMK
jgi:hypothetical protein